MQGCEWGRCKVVLVAATDGLLSKKCKKGIKDCAAY